MPHVPNNFVAGFKGKLEGKGKLFESGVLERPARQKRQNLEKRNWISKHSPKDKIDFAPRIKKAQSLTCMNTSQDIDNSQSLNQNKSETQSYQFEWQAISDPEERKKAILKKHGFTLREHVEHESSDIDEDDLDTIPSHILRDEILYKEYMKNQVKAELPSESEDETDHNHQTLV